MLSASVRFPAASYASIGANNYVNEGDAIYYSPGGWESEWTWRALLPVLTSLVSDNYISLARCLSMECYQRER